MPYHLAIFHEVYMRLGFPAGCAGHGVVNADVPLTAADVLHPFRSS